MTICRARSNRSWVKATAIVATSHPELALLIGKLHGNLRGRRVAKGIRQSFSGNAKDFVHDMALKPLRAMSENTPVKLKANDRTHAVTIALHRGFFEI
jgi:hypothetical protein